MTKVIQNQIDRIENNEQKFFWILLSFLVLIISVYGYCVNSAIFSVVRREKAEQTISSIKGVIAEKEAQYMNLKSAVTLDVALAKGFVAVPAPHFVSRDTVDTVAVNATR